jgi:transposase
MVSESVPAPDSLQQQIDALARRLEKSEKEHRAVSEENRVLREKSKRDDATIQRLERDFQEVRRRLEQFIRAHYGGAKNESISPKQLELALQGMAALLSEVPASADQTALPENKVERAVRERRPRQALDDDRLEQRETVIEPEEVEADPSGWTKLGEERTTQLDYEPGRLYRHVIVRPRYVRKEQFAIAPLPAQPIDKGMVGAGLLAWLLMSKYTDHLPLYRLGAMLHRQHGVEIPRNTLVSWVEQAADLLGPIYRSMQARLQKKTYLQVDETPIRYLDPEEPGASRQGYFWVYVDPGKEVLFQWSTGRAHEAPKEFLGDFQGTIQCDGYSAYTALVNARDGLLVLAHCWAHVRRAIREASSESSRIAAWFLRQIQGMYAIEKELRKLKAGPALRAAVRSSQTAMIVERVFKAMIRIRDRLLPGGAMAKALGYALERQYGLKRFLTDGRIEIDSNMVENAIRPSAVGRKNWLFIGHPDAGERSAIFYSLMASCRLHSIDPNEYLRDVLSRLPSAKITEIEKFTPGEWAKAKRLAVR